MEWCFQGFLRVTRNGIWWIPCPTFKIQKSFWGTFPFFWNGDNQNKQSGIFQRKNPRVLKTVFGWWFGGSVVEPISRNYMYHLMLYIHYTSLYIHTITYLALINLGDLMTKGYQRPRSNQQHTALAHKLFNLKTLHAEVTWKFATLAWQEWASRRSFEDTPWNVLFFCVGISSETKWQKQFQGGLKQILSTVVGFLFVSSMSSGFWLFSMFLHGFTLLQPMYYRICTLCICVYAKRLQHHDF